MTDIEVVKAIWEIGKKLDMIIVILRDIRKQSAES